MEFWHYVRMQMMWFVIVNFLCGCYEGIMGSLGLTLITTKTAKNYLKLECTKGIKDNYAIWEGHNPAAELYITLHIVIVMFYCSMYYVVFFVVPFRFNRIKKT